MPENNSTSNLSPIKHAVSTLDVVNAAVSRLNRQSIITLLDQLAGAIDTCCEDDLSAGQLKALVRSEIEGFAYSKELTSLVNLVQQEINRFDFVGSSNTSFGALFQTVFKNYDFHQSLTLKLAVDDRIFRYDYRPIVEAHVANYNFGPFFDKYLSTYDFRKANDSFRIALNGYFASFDFLNLTNTSFTALLDSHISAYDFRHGNDSFNAAVETRIARYNYREIFGRFLANYDFKGFVSPSLEAFIDSRIKNGSIANQTAFVQFFQTMINSFDFSASLNITNTIHAAIANYSFTNHTALTQVFNTSLEGYDFSNNTSLRIYLENNNADVRRWIDAAIQPIALNFQALDRARVTLEGRVDGVCLDIKDVRDEIDGHLAAINSLRLAFDNIQNLSSIKIEIETLQKQLEHAVALAGELDEHELGQVRKLFLELLDNEESAAIILRNLRISIDGHSRPLLEVVQALALADQIAQVSIEYPDDVEDPRLIKGCTYVLTDGTSVHFDCLPQTEPNGNLRLDFSTVNWKGIGASFSSTFARRSTKRRICKREVTLDWYEPVQSTNMIFAL